MSGRVHSLLLSRVAALSIVVILTAGLLVAYSMCVHAYRFIYQISIICCLFSTAGKRLNQISSSTLCTEV